MGLASICLVRFLFVGADSVEDVLLNLFFLATGVLVALSQAGDEWVSRNFRFLSFHWGKAIFSFVLSSTSVANENKEFIQVVMATYFFLVGCSFLTLAIADRQHDIKVSRSFDSESSHTLQNQKDSKRGFAILNIASDRDKTAKNKEAGQSGYSTADYGSDLFSDLGSDHENFKYGINSLRRPFF